MEKCEVDFYDVEIGNVVSVETDHSGQTSTNHQQYHNYESHLVEHQHDIGLFLDVSYAHHRGRLIHHNFTAREKWLLVELVDQCKHFLFIKPNKGEIRHRKMQVWAEITNEINAQCGLHRTMASFRKLWDYLSFRTKKALNDRARGVDPDTFGYIHFTPLFEKVATVLYDPEHPILQFVSPQAVFQHQQYHPFVEFNPQEDRKFDSRELINNIDHQPKSAVEAMRRLLYNSAPVRRKPSHEHHYCYTTPSAFDDHHQTVDHSQMETTYEDVLHCMAERDKSYRRMLEVRRAMLKVKSQVDSAKQEKKMAESQNISMETLKLRHLLGDLDPRFAGSNTPILFDPALMSDEEEAPEDLEKEL